MKRSTQLISALLTVDALVAPVAKAKPPEKSGDQTATKIINAIRYIEENCARVLRNPLARRARDEYEWVARIPSDIWPVEEECRILSAKAGPEFEHSVSYKQNGDEIKTSFVGLINFDEYGCLLKRQKIHFSGKTITKIDRRCGGDVDVEVTKECRVSWIHESNDKVVTCRDFERVRGKMWRMCQRVMQMQRNRKR